MSFQPTADQVAFVDRYVPFLEDVASDPEKRQWAEDYMADNAAIMLGKKDHVLAAVDKWELEKTIYGDLMRDAWEMGMEPEDYLEVVDGIRGDGGEPKPLAELSDYELVCLVSHTVRAERFVENALLFAVMDGTLLKYLRELQRRWNSETA